jgi:hypothetical protein
LEVENTSFVGEVRRLHVLGQLMHRGDGLLRLKLLEL